MFGVLKKYAKRFLYKGDFNFSRFPIIKGDADFSDLTSSDIIFLVTPGRSGTKSLIDYVRRNGSLCAVHAPKPCLATLGSLFWKDKVDRTAVQWSYFTARERYLYESYRRGIAFLDGDCKNLPLLPVLSEIYPSSKFVHVVRNPLAFVKSGLNRGYFVDKDPVFWGHLYFEKENRYAKNFDDQVKMIAEFWEISNKIASNLHEKLGAKRFVTLKSEDMFRNSGEIENAFNKIGFKLSEFPINKALPRLNKSKKPKVYDDRHILEIIEQNCPSAKLYYPEVFK